MPDNNQINRRRVPPSGGAFTTLTADDGCQLRVAAWPAEGDARGTVIFVNGRREFIEKHYETVADLRRRGLAVATMDWRGQGLSSRLLPDRQKGYVADFADYIADLDLLVRWAKVRLPGPYILMGHSMGGHCVMRYLAAGTADIAAAVLVAPMTGIQFGPLPEAVARGIIRVACRLGFQTAYALAQGPYQANERRGEADLLSSDLDRLEDEIVACDHTPDLALGGVTYGWLRAAMKSIDELRAPAVAEAISVPCLAVMGGRDKVVRNGDTRHFCRRLQRGRTVDIPDARHEILKERDELRAWFWGAFDSFLAKTVG